MAEPAISIIIPCRNEREHIETCLASTLAQLEPEGGFEVIIADGMSDDGTREILQGLGDGRWTMKVGAPTLTVGGRRSEVCCRPSDLRSPASRPDVVSGSVLRVIDNPGRIVSKGLNAAIRAARGAIIIRLDAHTKYAPDYICRCVEVLQQTRADNVGGPARTQADNLVQKAVAVAYHSPFSVGGARFHDVEYEGWVDTVTYGCWRKETFEKFGNFDEELVRNQDDEHNLRIIRGGGKIYQSPKIRSWYRPRSSLRSLFNQYLQYGYWKVRVIQKHRIPASWRHLVPGTFVLGLGLLFLLSAFSVLLSRLLSGQWSVVSGQWSAVSLLALLAAYALALITASLITAGQAGWRLFPVLPAVFACYHFGYGIGFLRGFWDFVIRRKGPQKSLEALTR
jgi:glycosyltransferase involved in cell wall biosynthesis